MWVVFVCVCTVVSAYPLQVAKRNAVCITNLFGPAGRL